MTATGVALVTSIRHGALGPVRGADEQTTVPSGRTRSSRGVPKGPIGSAEIAQSARSKDPAMLWLAAGREAGGCSCAAGGEAPPAPGERLDSRASLAGGG